MVKEDKGERKRVDWEEVKQCIILTKKAKK